MSKMDLIDTIIRFEWDDYTRVRTVNGKPSCDHQIGAFITMREAMLSTWTSELLESYLDDVEQAARSGRSLIAERQAWMMQRTDAEGYQSVANQLPVLPYNMCEHIDRIVKIFLVWQGQANALFPHMAKNGRPLLCEDDEPGVASFETNLRAALKSYSPRTVTLYDHYVMQCWYEGENLAIANLDNLARAQGFEDAAAAERNMS